MTQKIVDDALKQHLYQKWAAGAQVRLEYVQKLRDIHDRHYQNELEQLGIAGGNLGHGNGHFDLVVMCGTEIAALKKVIQAISANSDYQDVLKLIEEWKSLEKFDQKFWKS